MPSKNKETNRRDVARHRARRQERKEAILSELVGFASREPIRDDFGQVDGYSYHFRVPEDFYHRFEEIAQLYDRSVEQLMHETMAVYLEATE